MVAISQDASTDRHHLFLQIYAKLETQSKRCNTEIVFHRQWHLAWAKALDDHMQCHIWLWPPRASRAVFRSVLPVYIAWVVMIAFMDADGLWLWLAALSNRRLLYDWWIVGEKVDHVRRFPSPPHPTSLIMVTLNAALHNWTRLMDQKQNWINNLFSFTNCTLGILQPQVQASVFQ